MLSTSLHFKYITTCLRKIHHKERSKNPKENIAVSYKIEAYGLRWGLEVNQ